MLVREVGDPGWVHVDRARSAWLVRRFIDPDATFGFVTDPSEIPTDAIAFDMRGVDFSHHGDDCPFETLLRRHDLLDPVLWRIAGSSTKPISRTTATTLPRRLDSTSSSAACP